MSERNPLWVFTPSRTSPDDLEAILVQRHQLLQDAVDRVRESALTPAKHHLLFVGPRGCGKTHLATLIVHRAAQDAELAERLRIAWLNEDETCTSLLELLLKIHTALVKRYPAEYTDEQMAPAYERKPDDALNFVSRRLLELLGTRTLLLVVENLDAIFDSLGDHGQKQLRAYIQEHPSFTIVATAQRLVEELSDRASPFFGFFQTEHLKPLTVEEATQLLQNIARRDPAKADVVEFLATSRGHARVRALHHLSGGNHRIYIVLSQFITGNNIEALVTPFMKMVDELTPYYQERLRWLPPLQRRIVEYLCTCDLTVPVKDIARRLFTSPPTISSQLQDLREKGYVESSQRGRESLYEISEPLMRICVEVKDNQRPGPLRLLVDFLRVWYEDQDIKHHLSQEGCSPLGRTYLQSALERNLSEGNLRQKWLLHDLQHELPATMEPNRRANLIRSCGQAPEAAALALQLYTQGKPSEAMVELNQAIFQAESPSDQGRLLLCRSAFHAVLNQNDQEMEDLTAIIELAGTPADQVARALFNRGVCYGETGETEKAIADFSQVITLPDTPAVLFASAHFNCGLCCEKWGETLQAIAYYSKVITLSKAPTDLVATALVNRGACYEQRRETTQAIADYTQVITLSKAPIVQVAKALVNRGVCYREKDNTTLALADYTQVIALPDAPADLVAIALFNRGVCYGETGETEKAIADYSQVITLRDAPADLVAKALVNRGFCYEERGEIEKEIADFSQVIALPDATADLVATALVNRGVCHWKRGEPEKAIADYTQVIALPDAPAEQVARALVNRGLCYGERGEPDKEIADYTQVVSLPDAPADQVAIALVNRGLCYWQRGDTTQAIADHSQVISLADASAEQVAMALVNRGVCYGQTGETEKAIADYTQVISLRDASSDLVATALVIRGFCHKQKGETEKALADYSQVITLTHSPAALVTRALFNRGVCHWQRGETKQAIADFSQVVGTAEASDNLRVGSCIALTGFQWSQGQWSDGMALLERGLGIGSQASPAYTGDASDLVGILFAAGLPPQTRCDLAGQLFALYQKHRVLPALGEALVSHLGKVYQKGGVFPSSDNWDQWLAAWEQAAAGVDEFALPMRLLRTGIEFIKAGGKDTGLLLTLTSPERSLLKQAFALDDAGTDKA